MSTFQLAGNLSPFIARGNRAICDWEPDLTACGPRTGSRRGLKKQNKTTTKTKTKANNIRRAKFAEERVTE